MEQYLEKDRLKAILVVFCLIFVYFLILVIPVHVSHRQAQCPVLQSLSLVELDVFTPTLSQPKGLQKTYDWQSVITTDIYLLKTI